MDFTATIKSNLIIAKNYYKIIVRNVPEPVFEAFRPGRFAHVRVPNASDLLLRRPLAIYRADAGAGEMEFVYQLAGEGTRRLTEAKPGESVKILAPLGNGFSLPEGAKTGYVVGGGTGCAALLSVAGGFPGVKWRAFLGFPNGESVFGESEFSAAFGSVDVYTDDGSHGVKGNPADGLGEWLLREPPDVVFACGPVPMFLALRKALPNSVNCQISMEERMGCGVGACLVCACATQAEDGVRANKRVCADGPVFGLWEVRFDG